MPLWKEPFWRWITWFNAWPVSVEALSGVFDFNRAPFFQSFMEVRVERSKRRVALILNGVRGPLHWRETTASGAGTATAPQRPLSISSFARSALSLRASVRMRSASACIPELSTVLCPAPFSRAWNGSSPRYSRRNACSPSSRVST